MQIVHESDVQEGSLSDLIVIVRDTIRRRWLTLALVAAAVFALGVTVVMLMTPQYGATAQVRIDPARTALGAGDSRADQDSLSPEAIETEVAAISSLDLARRVVDKLHLDRDPEFTESIDSSAEAKTMSADERQTVIARNVLQNLSVNRQKLTYILDVTFTSPDPVKSARIANAFAEGYLSTKVGRNVGAAQQKADWFKQQLDKLSNEVKQADSAVASYRARTGITQTGDGPGGDTIVDQQVAPLSTQLATAESEAAAARAALQSAQQQVASGDITAVSQVRQSTVIADLRSQRAKVLNDLSQVEARYGPKHPESIRVRDQLSAIDAQIKDEAQRVMSSLRSDANAAEARAASLRSSMNRLEDERSRNMEAAVNATSLERDAAAKRDAYDRMSQMYMESTQAAQNQISQAAIVGRAVPPVKPTSPNKPLLFALSLIIAIAAGGGTIAIQEMMVSGLRSVDDVESQLGIPVLAAIPKMPRKTEPADILLERPTSLFAESLRIARASILGVRSAEPPQIIAITSALPSEGKTTTALAFARTLAISNAKTLLLECDVRRAALRSQVKHQPKNVGLVEVLHGQADIDAAISPGDVDNLDHLLVTSPYFSSEDLFGGGVMEGLLKQLRGRYEKIVLDLPPLVGLADGRFLAVLADATVLVIRWDSTPAQAAASAVGWLKADGANTVGAIFTMVDSSAEAIGGLYYSKKYAGYYQAAE